MNLQSAKSLIFVTALIYCFSSAVLAQNTVLPAQKTVIKDKSEEKKCSAEDYDCIIESETKNLKNNTSEDTFIRGLAYFKKGDYEKALNDLEKVTYYAEANLDLGNIYLAQAKFKLARASFSRAIMKNPNLSDAYLGRGTVFYSERYFEFAIEDFDRAIFINSRSSKAYYGLGNCYLKLAEQYEKAQVEESVITETYKNALKNFDTVEEIELSRVDPVVYFKRARAYEGLGKPEKAASERKKFEESGKVQ